MSERFLSRALAVCSALLLWLGTAAAADRPGIHSVDISLLLTHDGTARVTEVWDVTATEGTEWYLVRENLGDIVIDSLAVSDENGLRFVTEPEWNSDRSRSAKEGRCGILHKKKGVELCWGIGQYGRRRYTASYIMTNAVKSLTDADMLHLQLLSPGLSSKPEKVRIRVSAYNGLKREDLRFWGFGFEGKSSYEQDGSLLFVSEGRIDNATVLIRFEKGIFESPSVQERSFEQVLAKALEGARFEDEDEDEDFIGGILSIILNLVGFAAVVGGISMLKRNKKRVLGCKASEVQWSREVPFGGNLQESNYTLGRLGEAKKGNFYASALILRMIYDGAIEVLKKDEKKADLAFNDAFTGKLDADSRELYDMMKEAAGSDGILQDKEFSRWSRKHYKRVNGWIESSAQNGRDSLKGKAMLEGGLSLGREKYSPEGQAQARILLGFKKFLSDFTLISERGSREVGLWQDYLVFGALFGIADKVAKELHDIDPTLLQEATAQDWDTVNWLLWHNNNLAGAITNAQARAAEAMSRSSGSFGGFGGGTSFGGGGGFSGGGFGGGAR